MLLAKGERGQNSHACDLPFSILAGVQTMKGDRQIII